MALTPEERAAIQQAAFTIKRRSEATVNACTADPVDDSVIASECQALSAAWEDNANAIKAGEGG